MPNETPAGSEVRRIRYNLKWVEDNDGTELVLASDYNSIAAQLKEAMEFLHIERKQKSELAADLQHSNRKLKDIRGGYGDLLAKFDGRVKEHAELVIKSTELALNYIDQESALTEARGRVEQLEAVIRWALGEEGEFPSRPVKVEGRIHPLYWWRTELRKRALSQPPSPKPHAI